MAALTAERVRELLRTTEPKLLVGNRRAAVALLLRRRDTSFDVFFILRAVNPRDRWSGHVAFPGGRCEGGETDEAAAVREVREEVGWSLDQCATLLGRLDDRIADPRRGQVLVVSCFVYLVTDPPPWALDPAEVAACGWVPLSHFSHSKAMAAYPYSPLLPRLLNTVGRLLGLVPLYVPSVQLPVMDTQDTAAPATQWVLWGLTLGMLTDLLMRTGVVVQRLDRPRFWYAWSFHNVLRAVAETMAGREAPIMTVVRLQGVLTLLSPICFGAVLSLRYRKR